MFLDILVMVAGATIGMLYFSFCIMQILITLFCAIPMTVRLSHFVYVDKKSIYRKNAFTVLLWTFISAGIAALAIKFGNMDFKLGLLIGCGIALFLSLGKWGINESNEEDYIQNFGKYIDLDNITTGQMRIAMMKHEKPLLTSASHIVSLTASIGGIVCFFFGITWAVYICGVIAVADNGIQILCGGQENCRTAALAVIIGLIVAVLTKNPVLPFVAVALCFESVLMWLIGTIMFAVVTRH